MAPLPDGNPKTAVGRLKPSLRAIPPAAIVSLGLAMEEGEIKYGLANWRDRSISASVYYEAMMRHLLAWWDGEDLTPIENGVDVDGNPIVFGGLPHLAHVMACAAILIDGEMCDVLSDDRPSVPGPTGSFLRMLHAKRKEAAKVAEKPKTSLADQLLNHIDEINAERDRGLDLHPVDLTAQVAVEHLDGDSLRHRGPKPGEPMDLSTMPIEPSRPTLDHWGD